MSASACLTVGVDQQGVPRFLIRGCVVVSSVPGLGVQRSKIGLSQARSRSTLEYKAGTCGWSFLSHLR